jgi:hypothetical protein
MKPRRSLSGTISLVAGMGAAVTGGPDWLKTD